MNFVCQQSSHNRNQILLVCLNEYCNQSKLLSDKCIQQDKHIGHNKDLIKISELPDFFKIHSQECEKLIESLQKQMDSAILQFNQITDGLRLKYQLNEDKLYNLNEKQISQAVREIKKIQSQNEQIHHEFNGGIKNFFQTLDNIQSSLCLNKISYLDISLKDRERAKKLSDEGYDLKFKKKKFVEAIEKLDQSLSIYSFDNFTLWCKGDCLMQLGEYNEAILCFSDALDINPVDVESLCSKGKCLQSLENYNEALIWFDKTLNINPNHFDSFISKGECLRMLDKYTEAIVWLNKALEIDLKHVNSLFSKGESLRMIGKYDEALTWLNKALDQNPKHVNSLYSKGECLKMQGKYDEALTQLNNALDIDPKHVNSLFSKGDCLRMLGKYDEALTWLNKALDIDQNHVNSLFNKGDCLRSLRKYDEALTWLNKALDIDQKHVNSLFSKGDCLRMLGKYDEALTWLNKALALDPNNEVSSASKGFNQNIIAHILQGKKQYREAVQLFDKVLLIYPTWKPFIDGKGCVIVINRILFKANKRN